MKTKIILVSILSIFFFLNAKAQDNKFTITGEVSGLEENMFMYTPDTSQKNGWRRDSIIVENGKFTYISEVENLEMLKIYPGEKRLMKTVKSGGFYPVKSASLWVLIYPGANITISGEITDFVNAYPAGDIDNNSLAEINKLTFPIINKSVNYNVKATFSDDTIMIKALNDSADLLSSQLTPLKTSFIEKNTNSKAALWYLSDMIMRSEIEMEVAIKLFEAFDKSMSDISFYQEIQTRVNGYTSTLPGKTVPEISTYLTPDSSLFILSDLRGKYVIIDFWGTWCGPCIAGMPKMKEYRDKYKDKLELVGVASERRMEPWKKFIEKKNLDWYHVYSGTGEEDYVLKFNVSGFPTKIIVDPEGKIIKRIVGEDESFYVELDELLGN